MSTAVNVVVDGFAHLGPLSYLVPDGMRVQPGDAVQVPFGKREAHGLVIGPGDKGKATRELMQRHGARTTTADLDAARLVATRQATQLQQLTARLAPRNGKGAAPSDVAPTPVLAFTPAFTTEHHADPQQRLLLVRTPLVAPEELAAAEAVRHSDSGQVLVLCPTTTLVERVLANFTAGAVRLDAKAARGDWAAFREGHASVAVGTRAAAWYAPKHLAAIIVVEEQHEGHREQTAPRHHAREVAVARAKALSVPLILISANPTPAAIGANVRVYPVAPSTGPTWPAVTIHNEAQDLVRSDDLPFDVLAELTEAAKTGSPLVVIGGKAVRRCVGCFTERTPAHPLERCRMCGDVGTRVIGFDKERIKEVAPGAVPVLPHELGQYRNTGLVVVPDVSTMLARPELNPYRHAVDTLVDAASAAGRHGKLVAIVRDAKHPVLRLLLEDRDQIGIAKRVYRTAQRLTLPPFGHLATVQVMQKEAPSLADWPGHVHGPVEIKGGWEFLVRVPHGQLPALQAALGRLRRKKIKTRYHID